LWEFSTLLQYTFAVSLHCYSNARSRNACVVSNLHFVGTVYSCCSVHW